MIDAHYDVRHTQDPHHWRFYGLTKFQAACAEVMTAAAPRALTIGEIRTRALDNLIRAHFARGQEASLP